MYVMYITIILAVLQEIASPSCPFAGGSSHIPAATSPTGVFRLILFFLATTGRTPLFAWFDDPLTQTLFVLYSVASPTSGLLRTRLLM